MNATATLPDETAPRDSAANLRRPVWKTAVAVAVLIVSAAALLWCAHCALNPRLRAENASRIKPGTTLRRVESLLGGPAGHYGPPDRRMFTTMEGYLSTATRTHREWTDEENAIHIYFDSNQRVTSILHKRPLGPH